VKREKSNTLSLSRWQTKDPKTWFPLLGGSFVFLDVGPSIFSVLFAPILRALIYLWSTRFHHPRLSIPFFSSCHLMCASNQSCTASWQCVHVPQQHRPPIIYINSVSLSVCDGGFGGGGERGRWSSRRSVSVCDGGWTTTVSTPARCTNQDMIFTKHRSRPKRKNDGRIASLSHHTRGVYKNLPLPPPLPKELAII